MVYFVQNVRHIAARTVTPVELEIAMANAFTVLDFLVERTDRNVDVGLFIIYNYQFLGET